MNTQYRKNLKAVLEASKSYCDESIESLKWELGTYDLSVDTNTDTAHIKTLPSGTIQTTVSKVEGVGYKVNQLVGNLKATFTTGGVTFTNNGDGSMTLNGTATEEIGSVSVGVDLTANLTFPRRSHKVLVTCNNTLSGFYYGVSGYSINNSGAFFFNESNPTDWTNGIGCHIVAGTVFNNFKIIPQSFDLTADFGSGNEPTSVSDCATAYLQRGINIYEYTPQQSSIKNNAFTGATVEGQNVISVQPINPNIATADWLYGGGGSNYTSINIISKGTYTLKFFYTGTSTAYVAPIILYDDDTTDTLTNGFSIASSLTFTASKNIKGIKCYCNNAVSNATCMLVRGSTAPSTYVPYIQPTTISVDLTTIKDSNNVSLFPSGKLIGTNNADFITPYNQESRWFEEKLKDLNWLKSSSDDNRFYATIPAGYKWQQNVPAICSNYAYGGTASSGEEYYTDDKTFKLFYNSSSQTPIYEIYVVDTGYNDATAFKNHFGNNDVIQYVRNTYLTSNTDLTSLTKINAQSNGTIALNNTDNVDMPNTIKYLKEVAK